MTVQSLSVVLVRSSPSVEKAVSKTIFIGYISHQLPPAVANAIATAARTAIWLSARAKNPGCKVTTHIQWGDANE